MSRLVTQLVADEPAIILVGENTTLREKLAQALQSKNVAVYFLPISDVSENIHKLNEAYKVVWVCDVQKNTNEYLGDLQNLSKITTQLIVALPVVTGVETVRSSLLANWVSDTKIQQQFIIDCNYYLPSASFIFGQDLLGNNVDLSIFNYILRPEDNNILIDPLSDIKFITIDDYLSQIVEFIFVPKKHVSSVVLGKSVNSTHFLSLVKKLYDAYYNTNLEIIQDKIVFNKTIPFTAIEKTVTTDSRLIATHIVKSLKAPTKVIDEEATVIPSPSAQQLPIIQPNSVVTPLINQNIEKQQQPQQQKFVVQKVRVVPESMPVVVTAGVVEKPQVVVKPQVIEKTESADLNNEIQRIFKTTRTETKVERVENIVESTKKITKKTKSRTKLFYGGLLSIGMAVGILLLATIYLISGALLKKQVVSFLTSTAESQSVSQVFGVSLAKTADFVAGQTTVYSQILELDVISKNSVLVSLVYQFKELPAVLAQADQSSKNLVLNILNGSIGNSTELTENLTYSVSQAYERLSLIQATLAQIDLGENSEKQNEVIEQIGKKIQDIRSGLEIHQELQQVLPDMVGMSGKRTYALLLQNNQELRPTGGFIQAVALLNFDKGSLVSYQVYSIYELDKKLPGQVVPPEEIKTYLGETNWYLRDSNWSPDFPKSSKQIAWFIEKSLGVNVNGVIAMNVFSLSDLLKAVGPIDLPEYNEVLTDKNIEERMEFHSEVVLVDSPKSIDYSVKILTETLNKLSELKENSVPTLLTSLKNSLETKQTQIYSTVESEEAILQILGWTGALTQPSCPTRLSVVDCLVDNMAQVEANIGINKANYYLERTIDHKIFVSRESAQHTRTISFDNKAQSNSWPKGTYKTFIRFFVNPNATVEKALINGSELTQNQIIQTEEDGFKVVGLRVDVPIQKQITVELVYSTPLGVTQDFSYVFYNRKQSGLDADPFTISITHAPDIKPVLIAPNATITGDTIRFSASSLDEAVLFGVKFE